TAAMRLDQRSADRQAQSQAAVTPPHHRIPRLERVEDPGQAVGLDPDPGIRDLSDPEGALAFGGRARGIAGAGRDRTAPRGELDGILDQVPEDLLEASWVGADLVPRRGQLQMQLELGFL